MLQGKEGTFNLILSKINNNFSQFCLNSLLFIFISKLKSTFSYLFISLILISSSSNNLLVLPLSNNIFFDSSTNWFNVNSKRQALAELFAIVDCEGKYYEFLIQIIFKILKKIF